MFAILTPIHAQVGKHMLVFNVVSNHVVSTVTIWPGHTHCGYPKTISSIGDCVTDALAYPNKLGKYLLGGQQQTQAPYTTPCWHKHIQHRFILQIYN